MQRHALLARFNKFRSAVQWAMGSLSAVLNLLRREHNWDKTAEAAASLENSLREAEELPQELVRQFAWIEAPAPPLPPELVRELEGPAPDRK